MPILLEQFHFIKMLDPVADALASTVYSDVVELGKHEALLVLLHKGIGATGTSTITAEAVDAFTVSAATAIPFQKVALTGADDAHSAVANVTSAGFALTAGSSQLYGILIRGEDLASTGYSKVRIKAVESVDSPVLAGMAGILMGARYGVGQPTTAVA